MTNLTGEWPAGDHHRGASETSHRAAGALRPLDAKQRCPRTIHHGYAQGQRCCRDQGHSERTPLPRPGH